jgi:uncharacterized protein YrrD
MRKDGVTMTENEPQSKLPLNIGAAVHCPDGRCGTLERLVIDPRREEVTDLIVEKGFLLKEDRVIPVSKVVKATEDRIDLSVAGDEFEGFPEYDEQEFRTPRPLLSERDYAPTDVAVWMRPYAGLGVLVRDRIIPTKEVEVRQGVDVDVRVIGGGTPVRTKKGKMGEVDHVLVDLDTEEVTHLVVETGGLQPEHMIIDYDAVEYADEDGIFVDLGDRDLRHLPRYAPRGA